MAKYCDSVELEIAWGNWGYACMTPELEPLRKKGLLYRQQIGACIIYCIAGTKSFFFGVSEKIEDPEAIIRDSANDVVNDDVTSILTANNFFKEVPINTSWNKLTTMIYDICNGVALKFNPASEEERFELSHEALEQTLKKIKRGKLKFTPGRAPVFNLLTTAIIRIMYSIKNKEKRYRTNQAKLTSDISSNVSLPKLRSLKIASSTA